MTTEVGINGHPALGEGERYDTKQTPGKIFVGGLSSDASEADVKEYFGAYGTIDDVVVMKDKLTGTGRGFGFVTFADGNVADRVVSQRHEIKGRSVEAKSAVPRTEGEVQSRQAARGGQFGGGDMGDQRSTKVFVGGLSPSCDDDAFKTYFGGYGKIVDSQVMVDPHSGKSRGFGFVTFDDSGVVEQVMMKRDHSIMGKTVEVKKAFPRNKEGMGRGGGGMGGGPGQMGGGMMGRGGGMGGGMGGMGGMGMGGMGMGGMGMGGMGGMMGGGMGGMGMMQDPRMMQMYSMMMQQQQDPSGGMGMMQPQMGQMGGHAMPGMGAQMGGYPAPGPGAAVAPAPAGGAMPGWTDPYAQPAPQQQYAPQPAAAPQPDPYAQQYAQPPQQQQQPQYMQQPAADQYAQPAPQQQYAQPAPGGYAAPAPGGYAAPAGYQGGYDNNAYQQPQDQGGRAPARAPAGGDRYHPYGR